MILCNISDAERYYALDSRLAIALKWVAEHYRDAFCPGSVKLGDSGVIVNSQEPTLQPAENANLEAHRKYIDIHVPLDGEETMGWAPVEMLDDVLSVYDAEADFELFGNPSHSLFPVRVGQLAIFYPEDAHAPNIGTGSHHKYCVKVPVD